MNEITTRELVRLLDGLEIEPAAMVRLLAEAAAVYDERAKQLAEGA